MIFGLDVSSSITGATIVSREGELLYCEAWRTDKKGLSFYDKLDIIKDKICFVKTQYPIERVFVEEPFSIFAPGRSSASTISLIQRFNGVVCWMLRETLKLEPQYVSSHLARKIYGIKTRRGQKVKEVVLQRVLEKEKGFNIEYTKKGNPIKGTYDRSDSLVVAKAGQHLYQEEKKKYLNKVSFRNNA